MINARIGNVRGTILCLVVFVCYSGDARGDDCTGDSRKSTCTATAISIGATLGPMVIALPFLLTDNAPKDVATVLMLLGAVYGPATGHQYADNGKKMALALAVRGSLVFLSRRLYLSEEFIGYAYENDPFCDYGCNSEVIRRPGKKAAYVVGAICVATMIYDIMTAGRSVEAYNARLTDPQTRIYPYSIVGLQGIKAGLALQF